MILFRNNLLRNLILKSTRDVCEEAGWLFELDDDGCVLVVVPFLYPESEYDEDDAEGNQNLLCMLLPINRRKNFAFLTYLFFYI